MSTLRKVYSAWKRLCSNTVGAIAPIAALVLIALVPMTGMAVDQVYAWSAKRAMQEGLDAALLAVGRANPATQSEVDRIAQAAFDAQIGTRYGLSNLRVTIERTGDWAFDGHASGSVPVHFGGLFGNDSLEARVGGRVEAQVGDLELALVLDTTFSMTGNRIATLKTAARDLVDTLMVGENVKIGIVPFARYVNIGMANRRAPGFNIPDSPRICTTEMESRTEEFNCRMETRGGGQCTREVNCRNVTTPGQGMCNRQQCRNENFQTTCPVFENRFVSRTCYRDGTPYECGGTQQVQTGTRPCTQSRRVCTTVRQPCPSTTRRVCDTERYTCPTWQERVCSTRTVQVPVERCRDAQWHGCIGSRPAPHTAIDTHGGVDYPAALDVRCNTPLQTLTDNVGQLRSVIASLQVDDETYIPGGLTMGWAVLSPGIPFTEGTAPGRGSTRAMVLMTDGVNTVSKNSNNHMHDGSTRATADALTSDLCANIKRSGITMMTVAFEVTDQAVIDMLTGCASNPSYAFNAQNADQLRSAFDQIAVMLSDLRLSR